MSEEKIKKIVRRYKILSSVWLGVFLLLAIIANWYLVKLNIDRSFELGLENVSADNGYIWMALIIGLNVILQLVFYSLEKILVFLHQENVSSN